MNTQTLWDSTWIQRRPPADAATVRRSVWTLLVVAVLTPAVAHAQPAYVPPIELDPPSDTTKAKVDRYIQDVLEPDISLDLDPRKSKLIRTKRPVERFSVNDPGMVEVVQYNPSEFELIGGDEGQTTLTLWFRNDDGSEDTLRYLIKVERAKGEPTEYGDLQKKINELFPNSMIQLIPIADKLIVRGQARDAEEATQIMAIIRGQTTDQTGSQLGPGSFIVQGTAASPYPGSTDLPASQVVDMLDVPGEQQVMLKVRVAELTRSAIRRMGADFAAFGGDFSVSSLMGLNNASAFTAVLNTDDVLLTLQALSSNGYSKILAEPNLVTLSGRPARFIAGGEFAVPVVVGVQGAAAATTNFRGFGTQLTFTPTVVDKDRIRLFVAPSFSTLNQDTAVNGIPGLNSRAVSTTVDLREGQWLAIAGLIQDQQAGSKSRVPLVGDVPFLNAVFSNKEIRREETELLVLVSPELVHPMEPEQVPQILPGMEVTEPNDWDFFGRGYYEGRPNHDFRSTVAPLQRDRVWEANRQAHQDARLARQYQRSEKYYVRGAHGFSR